MHTAAVIDFLQNIHKCQNEKCEINVNIGDTINVLTTESKLFYKISNFSPKQIILIDVFLKPLHP